MPYLRTHGVLLRCTDFGDTSQVAAICTPDLGQVHVIAKGSRRPRKDGRGALDVLTHCDLVLSRRPAGQLQILAEWTVRDTFSGLRTDLRRFWPAFYAAEVALACTSENPDDGPICGYLIDFLRQLDRGDDSGLALFRFLTRSLRIIGCAPVTDCCAQCDGDLSGRTRFSPAAGGALCGDCAGSDPAAFSVSRGALAVMGRLAVKEIDGAPLRITRAQAGEIKRAFNEQIQYHLGRPLRTARFLSETS